MALVRRLPLIAAVALSLVALGAAPAGAAVVFDGTPSTAAPPSTLGPYSMAGFGTDPTPLFVNVTSVAGPTGNVGFSPAVNHRKIGFGWATWSHGYTGDVYWSNGATSVTMTMPAGTDAFYFYIEPNPFAVFNITATAQDGTTSGPVPVSGAAGAKYFGFYGTGGDKIASITASSTEDFAVGEFGIASGPTNAAPTVSSAAADANGTEGDTLSTEGSFSDPDSGDTLTLSVPSGTPGTFTDNGDGTWDWELATTDDVASASITVTADDGNGHTVTDSFDYSAANANPELSTLAFTGTNCDPILGFSFTDAGAGDTHTGSIDWGDTSSDDSFTTSPVSQSHSYSSAGAYPVDVSVADDDLGSDSDSVSYTVYNNPSGVLQPINAAGTRSVFKFGSTIPVKITVADCDGATVGTLAPQVSLVKLDGSPDGTSVEATSTATPTSGTTMRYDATGAQYIYNLATKPLSVGDWKVKISDASFAAPVTATFSLRK